VPYLPRSAAFHFLAFLLQRKEQQCLGSRERKPKGVARAGYTTITPSHPRRWSTECEGLVQGCVTMGHNAAKG
jgi:hypothetical protein